MYMYTNSNATLAYIFNQHIHVALNFVVFRAIKYIESQIVCLQKTYIYLLQLILILEIKK